ncbi:MAG TPA: hypothetical protein VNJ07_08340 [Chitinophagales bacterium]|nr:hypothetical protein [Chitinophagales bacterium]
MLVVASLKVLAIILTINRGFDFGDEGVYLLIPSHPYNTYHHSLFGVVTSFLHPGNEITILGTRMIKIVTDMIGLLILAFGAYRYSTGHLHPNASGFRLLIILLFAFLSFYIVTLCRTATYNEYILLSVNGGFGMAFLGYSTERKLFRRIFLLLAGGFIAFGFMSKPQSSILSLAVILVLPFLLHSDRELQSRTEDIFISLAGFASFIVPFALFFGFDEFIDFHVTSWKEAQLIGYTFSNMVKLFIASDLVLFKHLFLTAVSTILFLLFIRQIQIIESVVSSTVFIIIIAGIFSFLYLYTLDFHPDFSGMRFKVTALTISCIAGFTIFYLANSWSWKRFWFTMLMIILPILTIAGSSSSLIESLPQRYFSWFILCGIALSEGLSNRNFQRSYFLLACILIILSSYQFKKVLIDEPYMLGSSMWEQTHPMKLQNVKVDAATKAYIDTTISILRLNGFQPGDTVLAQNLKNGICYLLHAAMPVCPIYTCQSPEYNCYCLSHFLNDGRLKFVLSSDSTYPFDTRCPADKEAWKHYAARFKLLGSARNPLSDAYYCHAEKTYFFKQTSYGQ